MLLFHMLLAPSPFQAPLLRELCALCVKIPIPNPCTPSRNYRSLSLFPATQREVLPCRPFVRRSYQNTVSAAPSPKILTALFSLHKATKPLRIRTYEKRARRSFTIRTSKTQDLKSFRIRTYKKAPRGEGPQDSSFSSASETDPKHPSDTVVRSLLGTHRWKWKRDPCQNAWKVK